MSEIVRMHETALRAGIGVREFWGLCPCELSRVVMAEAWRWDRVRDRHYAGAWVVERLSRLRELPSLGDTIHMLTSDEPIETRRQSPELMLETARRIATALGGTVVERKKEAAHG